MNYRLFELPADRTAESFRFQIDAVDADTVDTIVTDDRDEAFRILGATLEQGYAARFRSGTETRMFGTRDSLLDELMEKVARDWFIMNVATDQAGAKRVHDWLARAKTVVQFDNVFTPDRTNYTVGATGVKPHARDHEPQWESDGESSYCIICGREPGPGE